MKKNITFLFLVAIMLYSIITLAPNVINDYCKTGIISKAIKNNTMSVNTYNLLDYNKTPCKKMYGGRHGMVITAQSILSTYDSIPKMCNQKIKVLVMSPSGKLFTNKIAKEIAENYSHVILISGRFEGIDYRVNLALDVDEISIGDFILSNGDLACNIIIDSVTRQLPGVVKSLEETRNSNSKHVYTRPDCFEYNKTVFSVPKELLSGNPIKIKNWEKKLV